MGYGQGLSGFGGGGSISSFLSSAMRSANGGHWSNGSGFLFGSQDEAFTAGVAYNDYHGSWANTNYGRYRNDARGMAIAMYEAGQELQNQDYSTLLACRNCDFQEERPDLGYIGNKIRDRAGSEFSKDMFENYWLGKGDVVISQDRFLSIWSAAMDIDSKGLSRKGKKYTLGNNAIVYAKTIDFYKSEEYKNVLGRATFIFDTNDTVIGFYDYYNFDAKKGARSLDAEVKTRMVREASRLSNALPFRMGYGVVPIEILRSRD